MREMYSDSQIEGKLNTQN